VLCQKGPSLAAEGSFVCRVEGKTRGAQKGFLFAVDSMWIRDAIKRNQTNN